MSRFTRPRFSFLDMVLAIVLVAACLWGGTQMVIDQREAYFREALARSDVEPPQVQLAKPGTPDPGAYKHDYEFTEDWFTRHIPSSEKAFEPYMGGPIHYLEIGVFEGRAAMWVADHMLTHPESTLTGLDLFDGDYDRYGDFEARYRANIEKTGLGDRAVTLKGYSQVELRKLPLDKQYDVIYIDGSHVSKHVIEDAVLSQRLLRPGGTLIFDDYGSPTTDPKTGIDAFYRFWSDEFEVIHNDHQVMMRKEPG